MTNYLRTVRIITVSIGWISILVGPSLSFDGIIMIRTDYLIVAVRKSSVQL
ncbi:MAG: hypothetical protein II947_10790 [Bacteroidaceae bacterium]|nr:hypothetical protein [Bacteroidaceae bacterium]